ncbi:MAG TPA: PASTA domain-containing protein, partial [Pilimelia sp.]|nr:PASTA domain-containing protein [Pilimelia sp.]
IALLLLAVLGYGLWLITNASDAEEPGGVPTTAAATAAESSAPANPTSAAPTSADPPATTAPAPVAVPPVVGRPLEEARALLAERGLAYRLSYRPTGDAVPGTVIEADPAPGSQVAPDSKITLVVAAAPRTTAAPEPTGSAVPTASATP